MVNSKGYFKIWRELISKPIWQKSTPEQCKILLTLLSMANFKSKQWEWQGQKFDVKEGQFITSLDSIKENCGDGITIQNIRTALKRFEKLDFLTNESTKTGRLITIVNWELYQANEEQPNKDTNKDLTKSQQRPNKDLTPREERKNDKNINKLSKDNLSPDGDKCPHTEIMDLYNRLCPSLPRINQMTESRQKVMRTWWKTTNLDNMDDFFRKVESSDFLTGKTGKFTASFDWIIKPINRQKIIEGNYDNREKEKKLVNWGNF